MGFSSDTYPATARPPMIPNIHEPPMANKGAWLRGTSQPMPLWLNKPGNSTRVRSEKEEVGSGKWEGVGWCGGARVER
jgi:hypothetical protein